jgi:two-component system cell cycle sensor histidine kinase/response regulator CckA
MTGASAMPARQSAEVAGVGLDVTEREEAVRALRESEERFRLIAEHAHDLIALLDVEGHACYLTPSCESRLGYPPGALVGTVAWELIDAEEWAEAQAWGTGELRELRLRKADGSWLWVEACYEITGRLEAHFVVIARDISERKCAEVERQLLEGELRQAHKMEAVGQLAGGIAHDFNNLLSLIGGYSEILLRRLGSEGDGSKEIVEIGKAAERATRLTRQLLAYSRKQLLEPRVLDLNAVVAETRTMLEPLVGENIELAATLAGDLGSINADNGQIEQVIMNLVMNARDAMPDGGKLLLKTRNVSLGVATTSGPLGTPPGDYVVLIVSDTGQGMDAVTAEQIFEPFYTTKERGAGTGLGLATVYGIVKQSGGLIEVESEPGVGTTFRIYFPRVAEKPETLRPKPVGERALVGSETVLLVEDDDALRGLVRVMLEQYGYTVLPAGHGAAALELAGNYPDPIELLMTDVLMPGIGGIELAERLSKQRPQLEVLYTSGYNDSGSSLTGVPGSRYLQKPYAMENLGRTLRELLDSAHSPADEAPAKASAARGA